MHVDWEGKQLSVSYAWYPNGRVAVLLMNGVSQYGRLSTNLANVEIASDEFLVPAWNYAPEFLRRVLETGLFQDTGRRVFGDSWNEQSEGPEAHLWRIVQPPAVNR